MCERPFLNDPVPGWKRDLPRPDDESVAASEIHHLAEAPSTITDTYIEISTSTVRQRGILSWVGTLAISASTIPIIELVFSLALDPEVPPAEIFFIGLCIAMLAAWFGLVTLRLDMCLPRDQPVRFNRLRRKVYAYHFDRDWKRPLSKKYWKVRVAIYQWNDIHAEVSEGYGPLGTGGYVQATYLSVRKNKTKDIIHRFILSHDAREGELYWKAVRIFMQHGRHALPTFQYPSKNRNDESYPLNIFWRFAPKVQWPEHIDIESRTAPTPGEQQ